MSTSHSNGKDNAHTINISRPISQSRRGQPNKVSTQITKQLSNLIV